MSNKRWFKFYGNDFFGGTLGWSAAQRGIYLTLLWASWESDDGTLPGEDHKLRMIAQCDWTVWSRRGMKDAILGKFERLPDGRIFNRRMMAERAAARLPVAASHRLLGVSDWNAESPNDFNGRDSQSPESRGSKNYPSDNSYFRRGRPRSAQGYAQPAPPERETAKQRKAREARERIMAHNERILAERAAAGLDVNGKPRHNGSSKNGKATTH